MADNIIHGLNAVREALRAGGRVTRLYLAKESRARQAEALLDEAKAQRVRYDYVPQAKLNELAGTREHQGVAAQVSPVEYTPLDECLAACGPRALLLACDQVQHPRNLGMLVRTAVGAGAAGLLLTARGGAQPDDTVLHASAGTLYHLPIVNCPNLAQALREVKQAGFWVYGLEGEGEWDVFATDWPDRVILVAGNETSGMRPGLRKNCDATVRIPLAGGLDSLNVAVASAIALFQAAHAHRHTG
jgi:23S rRNA (guanosine2251-2'-O)-methyltransferase